MREFIYGPGNGSPFERQEVYLRRYEQHTHDILQHFRGRDDFLQLDLFGDPEAAKKICQFLRSEPVLEKLPHRNQRR